MVLVWFLIEAFFFSYKHLFYNVVYIITSEFFMTQIFYQSDIKYLGRETLPINMYFNKRYFIIGKEYFYCKIHILFVNYNTITFSNALVVIELNLPKGVLLYMIFLLSIVYGLTAYILALALTIILYPSHCTTLLILF